MPDKILVTGASGGTGRRVVSALIQRGADVRAFIRREDAKQLLAPLGVTDFALGTLEDKASLEKAMQGVDQLLHICPPMHPQEDNIAKTLIDLCKQLGTRRFILWSVLHPVIGVPHHRRKLEAEQYLIESGQTYTILQPARYMQHLLPIWKNIVENGEHALPFSVTSKFSLTDLVDMAEAAASVATQPGHDFATYQLAAPDALSQEDCAAILTKLLGKKITARERNLAEFLAIAEKNGMPQYRLDNMRIMNEHYTAHGLVGNGQVLQFLLGRKPHTFAQFVQRELLAK
jgi:uncharacterized protein YbjT (DUF2867 family)